jgi:hypothetical protein
MGQMEQAIVSKVPQRLIRSSLQAQALQQTGAALWRKGIGTDSLRGSV